MKYLCKELREQYEISAKECGEINELQHPLIGMGDVLRAYYILADYFTDDSGGAKVEKCSWAYVVKIYWHPHYVGKQLLLVGE